MNSGKDKGADDALGTQFFGEPGHDMVPHHGLHFEGWSRKMDKDFAAFFYGTAAGRSRFIKEQASTFGKPGLSVQGRKIGTVLFRIICFQPPRFFFYPNKGKIHRPGACLFRNISQGRAKAAGGNDKVRPGEGMTEGFFHAVGIIPYHSHISHRIAMLIQESSQPLGIFISNFSQKKLRPCGNNFSNHRFSWKVRFFPQ